MFFCPFRRGVRVTSVDTPPSIAVGLSSSSAAAIRSERLGRGWRDPSDPSRPPPSSERFPFDRPPRRLFLGPLTRPVSAGSLELAISVCCWVPIAGRESPIRGRTSARAAASTDGTPSKGESGRSAGRRSYSARSWGSSSLEPWEPLEPLESLEDGLPDPERRFLPPRDPRRRFAGSTVAKPESPVSPTAFEEVSGRNGSSDLRSPTLGEMFVEGFAGEVAAVGPSGESDIEKPFGGGAWWRGGIPQALAGFRLCGVSRSQVERYEYEEHKLG